MILAIRESLAGEGRVPARVIGVLALCLGMAVAPCHVPELRPPARVGAPHDPDSPDDEPA